MITLIQPPGMFGLAGSSSPPCMKLETWLRIAGVPYEAAPWPPTKAPPKGKFPFIEDEGALMGDSTLIIDHLVRTRKVDPDEGLSPAERAISLAFRRMVKEHLYWVLMHGRYRDPAGWAVYREVLASMFMFPGAPDEVRSEAYAAVDGIQQTVLQQLAAQGLGRHDGAEIHALGIADLTAISDFLGDKAFFMGDRPTTADAAVYAYLAHLVDVPFEDPPARFARGRENLTAYCARMRARFYGAQ